MSIRAGIIHSSNRLYTSTTSLRTSCANNAAALIARTFSTTGCRPRWGDHNNGRWDHGKNAKSDGQQSTVRKTYQDSDERRPATTDAHAREVNNERFYPDRQEGYSDHWSSTDSDSNEGRRNYGGEERGASRPAKKEWPRRANKPASNNYRPPPSTRYFTAPRKGKHVRAQSPFSVLRHDHDVLVVYADGACFYNRGNPAAGIGVWFGPDSPYNISRRLGPHEIDLTNPEDPTCWERANRASELWAVLEALRQLRRADPELRSVIVGTDNHYVFRCMTEWIYAWRRNGWQPVNVSGEVLNRDLLEVLDKTVRDMESQRWRIRFWSLPKGKNQAPTELANMAVGKGKPGKKAQKVVEKAKKVKKTVGADNAQQLGDNAEPRRRRFI
jgi:ribonuclease HI